MLESFALADVAAYSGKDMLAIADKFAKGDLQPNLMTALLQPSKLHAFPREMPLPGFDILLDGLAMTLPEIIRHQDCQRLAEYLLFQVAEYSLRRVVHKQDL